jgi:Mg2+/Co2+ transporter CorB
VTILIFLLLEGFLSGSEMAMVAADRKKLARFAHSGPRSARLTFRILQDPSWFLSATLVGSNLAEVANVSLVTALLVSHFGAKGTLAFCSSSADSLFSKIIPKTLFSRWPTAGF